MQYMHNILDNINNLLPKYIYNCILIYLNCQSLIRFELSIINFD